MASPAAQPGMIRPEATLQTQEPAGESGASDESTSEPLRDTFEFPRGRAPRKGLGWKRQPFWKENVIDKSPIGESPEITCCLSDNPSSLQPKKTGTISETDQPGLNKVINQLYEDAKTVPSGSSSTMPSAPRILRSGDDEIVDDSLIGAVIAVRYDIFPTGAAAYLVEWRTLPGIPNKRVDEEWIEENRMPDRYVQAQKERQTSDILEYGLIDIPPAPENSDPSVETASPASSSTSGSPAVPRASQNFPLSPPHPYSPPPLKFHDDIASLHDDSSDDDSELQELMNKIRPNQHHAGRSSSTLVAKTSITHSQMHLASAKKTSKPVLFTGSGVGSPTSLAMPLTGRTNPKSPSVRKEKSAPVPRRTLNDTLSSERSLMSKAKRKAESLSTPSPRKNLEPTPKRPKSKHLYPRKHDEFYHLDGNVIIETSNSTHFKLHRSRLARQSDYFADLFEQKDGVVEALEMVDNHPLYTISGVSVQDFTVLLGTMDNAITFFYNHPSFEVVASILRASTTLSFPHFREWAVHYLEEMWSDDLKDLSSNRLNNAVETIALGRNYGAPGVLKRAYYELLRTGGLGHQDIDEDMHSDEDAACSIARSDTKRLIYTREKLQEAWFDTLASGSRAFNCPNAPKEGVISGQPSHDTVNAVACPSSATKMTGWNMLVYTSGMFQEYMYDVLCGLEILVDRDWQAEDGYCVDCTKMRRDAWQKQRAKLWGNLDLWLEL